MLKTETDYREIPDCFEPGTIHKPVRIPLESDGRPIIHKPYPHDPLRDDDVGVYSYSTCPRPFMSGAGYQPGPNRIPKERFSELESLPRAGEFLNPGTLGGGSNNPILEPMRLERAAKLGLSLLPEKAALAVIKVLRQGEVYLYESWLVDAEKRDLVRALLREFVIYFRNPKMTFDEKQLQRTQRADAWSLTPADAPGRKVGGR